jgi:hypothetical protein
MKNNPKVSFFRQIFLFIIHSFVFVVSDFGLSRMLDQDSESKTKGSIVAVRWQAVIYSFTVNFRVCFTCSFFPLSLSSILA